MLLRFGPNELDPESFELRRASRKIRLASRPMELLLILANSRGVLVTREEIARRLWPGIPLEDLDTRINTAIAQIRAALNDNSSRPRYVETVIGKGYRFIEVVEVSNGNGASPGYTKPNPFDLVPHNFSAQKEVALQEPAAVEPSQAPASASKLHYFWLAGVLALAGIVAIGIVVLRRKPTLQKAESDGNLMMTALTTNNSQNPISVAALSPDGRFLAYVDTERIFLRQMETGRTHLLKGPIMHGLRVAWFADGTRLLVTMSNLQTALSEIWIIPTAAGEPRMFRSGAESGVPSPDGQNAAFTVDNGREIRLASIDGASERTIARGRADEVFSALYWPRSGKRISYEKRRASQQKTVDIETSYEWSYGSRDIDSGKETASVSDVFFESGEEAFSGELFYVCSRHNHGYFPQKGIYTVRTNAASGAFLETPKRILQFDYKEPSGISVAGDGRRITTILEAWQPDIYIGLLSYPGPIIASTKRLTADLKSDFPHGWDPGSEILYFESNRVGGKFHIFRQGIGSPHAEMLTVGERRQRYPMMAANGRYLIYEELTEGSKSICRANPDGSNPQTIWNEGEFDEWRCAAPSESHCVLREIEGHDQFVFYALDLEKGKGRELSRTAWMPTVAGDWSLSADGRVAAIPNHDERSPSIRLVPLDGSAGEREVKVKQPFQLWSIQWAPDGTGLYSIFRAGNGFKLQFISLSGDVRSLRDMLGPTWPVPAPDGKKIAFLDSAVERNVYLWENGKASRSVTAAQ